MINIIFILLFYFQSDSTKTDTIKIDTTKIDTINHEITANNEQMQCDIDTILILMRELTNKYDTIK